MIVKGLSKNRLAEVGKIKIGFLGPKTTTKNGKVFYPPKKLDYFIVTTTEKDKETNNFIVDKKIMALLGPKPKEISIRLPFDSIPLNFFTSFQMYSGNKLICQGDGEKAKRYNKSKNIYEQCSCNADACQFLQDNKCKVSGILSCFLSCNMEIGGIYRFRTHSWNSVSSILSALEYFSEQTNGILMGMPLKLKLVKKATERHGNIAMVTIVLDIEVLKLRELALNEFKTRKELVIDMKLIEKKAVDAGFNEDTDNPKDVQSEFYPDNEDVQPEYENTIKDHNSFTFTEKELAEADQDIGDHDNSSYFHFDADADAGFESAGDEIAIRDFFNSDIVQKNKYLYTILDYILKNSRLHNKASIIIDTYQSTDIREDKYRCIIRLYLEHDKIKNYQDGAAVKFLGDILKAGDESKLQSSIKTCYNVVTRKDE